MYANLSMSANVFVFVFFFKLYIYLIVWISMARYIKKTTKFNKISNTNVQTFTKYKRLVVFKK